MAPRERKYPALVKSVREQLGLSQEDLARELGLSFATVNHWENGKRTPQPYLVRRLLELKQELNEGKRKR